MANTLQFWLSYNSGAERLRLPVNPEIIRIVSTYGYEDIEVSDLGERTIIGNDKLREFSINSFFPRDYNASYCEYDNIPRPWETVTQIERWRSSGQPIRLSITGTPINIAVTIRSFSYEERAGEPGDIYYELQLKEYTFINFRKYSELKADSAKFKAAPTRVSSTPKMTSYKVKSGDSLWKIAQNAKVYGDGSRWKEIYEANKKSIGPNPNNLKAGITLVIP